MPNVKKHREMAYTEPSDRLRFLIEQYQGVKISEERISAEKEEIRGEIISLMRQEEGDQDGITVEFDKVSVTLSKTRRRKFNKDAMDILSDTLTDDELMDVCNMSVDAESLERASADGILEKYGLRLEDLMTVTEGDMLRVAETK